MENLFEVLSELTAWCRTPGYTWTLMSTIDGEEYANASKRRHGFQLLVMDHEHGVSVWTCQSPELAQVAELVRQWLSTLKTKGTR